jgi:hypothetical protein
MTLLLCGLHGAVRRSNRTPVGCPWAHRVPVPWPMRIITGSWNLLECPGYVPHRVYIHARQRLVLRNEPMDDPDVWRNLYARVAELERNYEALVKQGSRAKEAKEARLRLRYDKALDKASKRYHKDDGYDAQCIDPGFKFPSFKEWCKQKGGH